MKFIASTVAVALGLLSFTSNANADLTDVLQDGQSTKSVFAVFDISGKDIGAEKLQASIISAIKVYATRSSVGQGLITSDPESKTVPQMTLSKKNFPEGQIYEGQCEGELFSIIGLNESYLKYGEITSVKACLYEYAGGYRLNYLAVYLRQTTTSSAQGIGSMLGRAIAGKIGLGDSSKFVYTVLDDIEKRGKEDGYTMNLVKLLPAVAGRLTVADPAASYPAAVAVEPVVTAAAVEPVVPRKTSGYVSSLDKPSQAVPDSGSTMVGGVDQRLTMLGSRKELTSMGFKFYDQDQFVDSVRRSDFLTYRFFIAAGAISPSAPDSKGDTASALISQGAGKGTEIGLFQNGALEMEKAGQYFKK